MITWIKRAALAAVLAAGVGLGVAAQEKDRESSRRFGDDLFAVGSSLRIAEAGLEDVFAAGRTVVLGADVSESVHVIGRRVRIAAGVGRDAYAAGEEVEIAGAVVGDVAAIGEEVAIVQGASVGQDVLLAGRSVVVAGPVGGDASLTGETVEIAAPISGSVRIRAERIRFGPGARIDGTLNYKSPNRIEVPASVIPPERVTGELTERKARKRADPAERPVRFLVGLVIMLILGAVLAALVPGPLARAHEQLVARPWMNLLMGVIAASAFVGSILVLALSLIGIPLVPVVVIALPLVCLIGYLTAAYVLGRLSLGLARARPIAGRLGVFTAIAVGLLLLAVLRLIPILGWLVLVLAVIMGLGAWFLLIFRPRQPAGAA